MQITQEQMQAIKNLPKAEQAELLRLLEARAKMQSERNDIYQAYRLFHGRYAVLIGGSGSGKSYEIADKHIDRMVTEEGHRILCCRVEQKQISESQVPLIAKRIQERYPESFAAGKWKINLTKGHESITYLPNKNQFIFWGLDDPEKLKSIFDITSVWIEEADQIEPDALRELERRLRGYQGKNKSGSNKYMQISFSFNPVHETCYMKPLFFDNKEEGQLMLCGEQPFDSCLYYKSVTLPDFNEKVSIWDDMLGKEVERYKCNTLVIHSTFKDNKFIDDTYSQMLLKQQELNPEEFRVYALGQWGMYGNAFFKEWDAKYHVCEPFPIPDHWDKYIALDYGFDRFAVLWIAMDTSGNAFVYKELGVSDLIIAQAAQRMKAFNGKDKIKRKYAPPDLENRRQETGRSAFDIFRENGEILTRSNNNREHGWYAVREWLGLNEVVDEFTGNIVKRSKMQIFSNCTELISCIPQLRQRKNDPNDVDPFANHEVTHMPDALRYFCVMHNRPTQNQNKVITFNRYTHFVFDDDDDQYSILGGAPSDDYIKFIGE